LRRIIFVASLVFCAAAAYAQQNQLDGDPTLFTVMAALNAAGYDAGVESPVSDPLRKEIRAALGLRKAPVISDLKSFVRQHAKRDPGLEYSQYVSFALAVGEPPGFKPRYFANEMPPDAVALEGLGPLLTRFYSEAGIEDLWRKSQTHFDKAIERYHAPVSRAVTEVSAYLRNPGGSYMGRRFQIFLDLLGPPNQIQTRSYKDDYFIVITPSAEPRTNDVRHAFLHFLLDPITTKFSAEVNKKRSLLDIAEGAPLLAESYKEDFLLLTTESLIKAIESRMTPGSAENRQALMQEAVSEGFILAAFFAEHLPLYEKQESAMRLYFPDMVSAIDLKKEDKRFANIQFATSRPKSVAAAPAPAPAPLTGAEKTFADAEKLYADRDFENAKSKYLAVMQQTPDQGLHARSYYGLARIAALQKDPDLAEKLFHKTLELGPDPQTRSWTQVFLGRLADLAGQREQAVQYFRAAMAVEGASAGARKAAEQGLQNSTLKNQ
jgi:tetratricopeptide (TPR) repeat protein